MAEVLIIRAGGRDCAVSPDEADLLVSAVKREINETGDAAWGLGILLEEANRKRGTDRQIAIEPPESSALLLVLDKLRLIEAPLSDALECVRDGLLIEEGLSNSNDSTATSAHLR